MIQQLKFSKNHSFFVSFSLIYFAAGIFRAVLPFLREISVYACPDSASPDNRFYYDISSVENLQDMPGFSG